MSIRALIRNLAEPDPLGLKSRPKGRQTPPTGAVAPIVMKLLGAERSFADLATSQGGSLWRNGWPDFLVELGGRTVGVEIKRGEDRISQDQARMFAALEAISLQTFVWNPRMPTALIPWRDYMAVSSVRSAAGLAANEAKYRCAALEELS